MAGFKTEGRYDLEHIKLAASELSPLRVVLRLEWLESC
jgi:hypothetical protein